MIYIFFNLLHTFDNFKLHEYHIKKRIHAISVFFVRVQKHICAHLQKYTSSKFRRPDYE